MLGMALFFPVLEPVSRKHLRDKFARDQNHEKSTICLWQWLQVLWR